MKTKIITAEIEVPIGFNVHDGVLVQDFEGNRSINFRIIESEVLATPSAGVVDAVAQEREACTNEVEYWGEIEKRTGSINTWTAHVAAAIRGRATPPIDGRGKGNCEVLANAAVPDANARTFVTHDGWINELWLLGNKDDLGYGWVRNAIRTIYRGLLVTKSEQEAGSDEKCIHEVVDESCSECMTRYYLSEIDHANRVLLQIREIASDLYADRGEDGKTASACNRIMALAQP